MITRCFVHQNTRQKKRGHDVVIKTYCHGDTNALLNIAVELDIVNIINKYIPIKKDDNNHIIEDILKYEFIKLNNSDISFTYFIDEDAFDKLKKEVLGRRILVTNRHEWTEEEIILAYRGQSKVEYVFKNIKNPYHLAIRPQYHWTDQKIEVHMLICLIGYILTISAFNKVKNLANYKKNINNFMNDLKQIRLAVVKEEKGKNKELAHKSGLREVTPNLKYQIQIMTLDLLYCLLEGIFFNKKRIG